MPYGVGAGFQRQAGLERLAAQRQMFQQQQMQQGIAALGQSLQQMKAQRQQEEDAKDVANVLQGGEPTTPSGIEALAKKRQQEFENSMTAARGRRGESEVGLREQELGLKRETEQARMKREDDARAKAAAGEQESLDILNRSRMEDRPWWKKGTDWLGITETEPLTTREGGETYLGEREFGLRKATEERRGQPRPPIQDPNAGIKQRKMELENKRLEAQIANYNREKSTGDKIPSGLSGVLKQVSDETMDPIMGTPTLSFDERLSIARQRYEKMKGVGSSDLDAEGAELFGE